MQTFKQGQRVKIVSDDAEMFDTSESEGLIDSVGRFLRYDNPDTDRYCWVEVDGAAIPMMAYDLEPAPTAAEVGQLGLFADGQS